MPTIFEKLLQNRKEAWRELAELNIERARSLHDAGQMSASNAILASIDGGKCTICGLEYKPVIVKNDFADFTYYMPSCKCYPKCWHCGTVIIERFLIQDRSVKHCPNCKIYLLASPRKLPEHWVEDQLNIAAQSRETQYHKLYVPKGRK